jgi:hypothetical protein
MPAAMLDLCISDMAAVIRCNWERLVSEEEKSRSERREFTQSDKP